MEPALDPARRPLRASRAAERGQTLRRLARPAAIAAAIALPGIALWALASRSYFAFDDFYNLQVALREGLTLHFLREPIFQHFAPGHHLVDWLVVHYFPLRFGPPLALLLALHLGAAVLLQLSLDTLFGRRYATVALTALFASSLFVVSQLDWPASGEHEVPAAFFTLLSLYGYLRYALARRPAWLAVSVAAFCAGLLFFVKPLLLPFVLLALRLLFLGDDEDIRPRRAAAVIAREWRVWLLYALPSVAYLVNFFNGYWEPTRRPAVGTLLDFLQLSWLRALFPGFVGILPVESLDAGGVAAIVAGQALLVLLVAVSVRATPRAWRAWAFLLLFFLANMLMVGINRVGIFGAGVAYDTRYYGELGFLLPLALAFALLSYRRPYATHDQEDVGGRGLLLPAALAPVVVAALVAHAALAWHSASAELDRWPGTADRGYFAALSSSLGALARRGPPPNLADVSLPEKVIGSWLAPYNYASNALAVLRRPLVFDDFARPLWTPDASGRLRPAHFVGVVGGPVSQLRAAVVLALRGARLRRGAVCVPPGTGATLDLRLRSPISGPRYFVRIDARGAAGIAPSTRSTPDAGAVPASPLEVHRSGPAFGVLDTQQLARLTLTVDARTRFCIDSLAVGAFVPGDR